MESASRCQGLLLIFSSLDKYINIYIFVSSWISGSQEWTSGGFIVDEDQKIREVVWIGSSRKDMSKLPQTVKRAFGTALLAAQMGVKPPDAKPLKGFGGAGVLEIVEDFSGDAYRAVYTVRFANKVYVLHVFQKKSKKGISTPKHEIDLIKNRLKMAEELHSKS